MAQRHTRSTDEFLKDVAQHKMTILRDDGVYRHIHFSDPDEPYCQWFDLITWPGGLCYTGDMGTYVFRRLHDMFEFFRRDPRQPELFKWIDRRYWAEKVESQDRDGVTEFDAEMFGDEIRKALVSAIKTDGREHLNKEQRRELWDEVHQEVIDCVNDHEPEVLMHKAWEYSYCKGSVLDDSRVCIHLDLSEFPDCKKFTLRFDWCCYALRWGIEQYDQAKAAAKVEEVAHV